MKQRINLLLLWFLLLLIFLSFQFNPLNVNPQNKVKMIMIIIKFKKSKTFILVFHNDFGRSRRGGKHPPTAHLYLSGNGW